MPSPKRHNVVLIMVDQQRWDLMGCAGASYAHTPHMDRLAAGGRRFANAFTTNPVCTPARAAIFTGMFPSGSGAYANQLSPHRHVAFLGEHLAAAGVAAGYTGKWHLDGPAGGYFGTGVPDGGFDPEYWYDGKRFMDDVGPEGFARWKKGVGLTDADCWGTRVADRAVRFIETHSDRPFVFVASFDEPHQTGGVPERFYKLYQGATRPWQDNMGDTLEGKPAIHRAVRQSQAGGGYVPPGTRPNNSPRYFGEISFVDEQIGRILDAIERCCPLDTAVIFTGDHGSHLGAHGLTGKGMTMYEEAIRVPLIVRVPELTRPGTVSEALFSQIRLAPTICRLAGVAAHEQFTSGDAMGLLADPAAETDEAVFLEFNRFGLPHSHWWGFAPIRCIRTRRHKLALNLVDVDELYDLQADPGEMVNRIDDPALAGVRDELHDRLLEEMERRQDPFRGIGWHRRPWRDKPLDLAPAGGLRRA